MRVDILSDDEDIVVDDLPINNIRKLVARQMSMSIQLVIQMLLLVGGDEMHAADAQLTSLLMELSNLRDGESVQCIASNYYMWSSVSY